MLFKNILVALDGSRNSQIAADYAFWIACKLGGKVSGQHVVDPRLVDLFIEPEFAELLGFSQSINTAEKVSAALCKIGNVVLELFATEAVVKGLKTTIYLDEGYTVEKILGRAADFDLVVIGHRGRKEVKLPSQIILGSVAERIAVYSPTPVLISVQPVSQLKEILVAYDGSEASRGALLMAESLAKEADCALRAVTVIPSSDSEAEAKMLVADGLSYLREDWGEENVFSYAYGGVAQTILEHAASSQCLLVLGAYGYRDPEMNVLGSTTTKVIRDLKSSVLIYKPPMQKAVSRNDLRSLSVAIGS